MHTNGHSQDAVDPSAGYEQRDISLHIIIKWIAGLYIFIFITIVATIPLFFLLAPTGERTGLNELKLTVARKLPEPVLQSHPIQDMRTFQRNQQNQAASYGRIEGEPGRVHIPVNQAMESILAQGLPSKSGAAPPPPAGIYTPVDTTAAPPAHSSDTPDSDPGRSPVNPTVPSEPAHVPEAITQPEPMTNPRGVTEGDMRGGQTPNTPAPRRDEPGIR